MYYVLMKVKNKKCICFFNFIIDYISVGNVMYNLIIHITY